MTNNFQDKVNFIWSIAELLRGDYRQVEYQDVILPFTVLRRVDTVLEPTKDKVLDKAKELKKRDMEDNDLILRRASGYSFYNTSQFTFKSLVQDADNIAKNLRAYINGFSANMCEVLENFEFATEIKRLDENKLLLLVMQRFYEIDLHPDVVPNYEMGIIFEELIRRFSEQSDEAAGERFTPREVVRLMVRLIIAGNGDLKKTNIIRKIYDPASGPGGMLTVSKDEIIQHVNKTAKIFLFGQELNPKTYAIAKSDILIKGEEAENIKKGNSFSEDQLNGPDDKFDYMLSNPPFGVEWKKVEEFIRNEFKQLGFKGRFGAGLPRISDGSFLFLQHMISKMKPVSEGGSRIAIVFNGSPLFTGDAGSGESEIRRWIIENDWLETILALPSELFYNTGIHTYIWVVTNRKQPSRKGKVQLINAVTLFEKMRKSLGNKRNFISEEQINQIVEIYKEFKKSKLCKIYDNTFFGYRQITIERPLRLNFQASAERIEKLKAQTAFINLAISKKLDSKRKAEDQKEGQELQKKIIKALNAIGVTLYNNQDKFIKVLDERLTKAEIEIKAPVKNAILEALSERDETADIVKDSKGNPEPDAELRDSENVPLNEDINGYFKREVLPHIPDAWISQDSKYKNEKDNQIGKIGYEFSITRYFYEYKPLRPLNEIEKDIKTLEKEILETLKEL